MRSSTDCLWVSRQRADGAHFTFVPYSTSVGTLDAAARLAVASLADLKGKKIGIAGGPVDKSWLVIRALAQQRHGIDLATAAEPVFGAPPLMNEKIEEGELDAVLNYWHFIAELEAKGYKPLVGVDEADGAGNPDAGAAPRLRVRGAAHPQGRSLALVLASRQAKDLLARPMPSGSASGR